MIHPWMAGFAWAIAAAWVYKLLEAATGFPKVPNLLEAKYAGSPQATPCVVAIVPARNEEASVGECVHSLLRQDYEALRVIAVNDRSTDGTGAVLDSLQAENREKLQVIHVRELPGGWLGKTHAMATAAREATAAEQMPAYLLFTDADVVFTPDAVRRALNCALQTRADHFVLMPTTIAKSMGEGMVLSYMQTMSLWAMRPWRVPDPRAMRDAIGVGAFNLVRTDAYKKIGGFEATPMEVLEDLYLGRRIKWSGLRQMVAVGPGMASVHWAAGALGILHGTTKNIFATFRFRPWLLLAAAAWVAAFSIAPVVWLAIPGDRAAGGIALAAVAGTYALSSRVSRLSPLYALFFPVASAMVVYAMLRSMFVTLRRGGVTWRGTFYRLADLRLYMVKRPEQWKGR
ncbi:MAG TPA: glycosyltransferase [Acidobacteriaceae bacterium]|nr:glycosyltransferase [Acidobacteriaceae bacterium]